MMRVRLLITGGVVLLLAGTAVGVLALMWLAAPHVPNGETGKQMAWARLMLSLGGLSMLLGLVCCAGGLVTWRRAVCPSRAS